MIIFSRSMAALFSLLINVAMSLTSSFSDVGVLVWALAVASVADLANVVPMLKVSPNNLSLAVSFVFGGSFCLIRRRSQRRLRTKLWNQGWLPCHGVPLKSRLYCQPSSSTSRLMSTYQLFQSHTQLGSGTCAFVILTADGLNFASTQGAGSILKFHNAFEENNGIPKTNQPRWFSYRTSMCEPGACGSSSGCTCELGVFSPSVWSTRLICWSSMIYHN